MLPHDKDGLKSIRRQRVGGEPLDEAEHFHVCGDCGQAFDLRSLVQVIHHNEPRHNPLTQAELSELSN